jgi:hypothetical protein
MSLKTADPKGRVDVALYRGAAALAEHVGAKKAFDSGLGDVIEELIENAGISNPITLPDVARHLGILPRRRRNALR